MKKHRFRWYEFVISALVVLFMWVAFLPPRDPSVTTTTVPFATTTTATQAASTTTVRWSIPTRTGRCSMPSAGIRTKLDGCVRHTPR